MQFTIPSTLAVLGLFASTTIAAPHVGYGQELQNGDQANHWVVWIDGQMACPVAQVLGGLTGSPCGQRFQLQGSTLQLCNCDSNNEPENVCDGSGNIVETCSSHGAKVSCSGSQHDIVQHGRCS